MEISILVFGFIIGAVLGSFIKAIADRSIGNVKYTGRSYCESCKKQIHWYDLFPVFSFLILRGKCRNCKKPIPLENFIVELIVGLISAITFWIVLAPSFNSLMLGVNLMNVDILLRLIFDLFVIVITAIILLVDLKTYIIPDRIIFPATAMVAGYLILSSGLRSFVFYQEIMANPLGKYLMLPHSNYFIDNIERIWVSVFYNLLSGLGAALFFVSLIVLTRGRGMGWGDVKYVFLLGLILGFPNIVLGLLLAFVTGAVFSIVLIIFGKKSFGQTIPFGPFLSVGALIMLLYGPQILNKYLSLSTVFVR